MKRRKKRFNWALYENLRQIEREEAFRLLKWAVDSLPPPWDSGWKGIGRKPYDARALTVVTIWREIEGKSERAYTADFERDKESLRARHAVILAGSHEDMDMVGSKGQGVDHEAEASSGLTEAILTDPLNHLVPEHVTPVLWRELQVEVCFADTMMASHQFHTITSSLARNKNHSIH